MEEEEAAVSRTAKVLYRPVGLVSSVASGLIANAIFKKVWRTGAPGAGQDPPGALATGHRLPEILAAAALQGAIFSLVKTLVDRGGAKAFEKWSGEWPGS